MALPRHLTIRASTSFLIVVILLLYAIILVPLRTYAATLLDNRSDSITNPMAGEISTHQFGLTMLETGVAVGSIAFEFCSNSPIPGDNCIRPVGLDASNPVLAFQSGNPGFAIDVPSSSINRIVLSRAAVKPAATPSIYRFDNIVNPDDAGTYYVRIQTYASTTGTGTNIENGGVVFSINSALNFNAEVPPYLKFCVSVTITNFDCSTATSYFLDLGELRSNSVNHASSQFVAATNAQSGYSIILNGTSLISGNNVIPAMGSATNATAGTNQFGINLRLNISPSVGSDATGPGVSSAVNGYGTVNQFKFVPGDTIVSVNGGDDNHKFTVSYVANVNKNQPTGVYATTISYICLANF